MTTGQKIKIILKNIGYHQSDLARDLGISRITISRFCNGKTDIHGEKLIKICQHLGIEIKGSIEKAIDESALNAILYRQRLVIPASKQREIKDKLPLGQTV